jgi:tRNASer (uridine44-2'-O)-methyltransferase
MEEDKLRIPSTKRICFVGRARKPASEPRDQLLGRVRSMVREQSTTSFAPRPADIPVKNCTRLPSQVKSDIVRAVATMCLEQKAVEGDKWNAGGLVPLAAAASGLPKDLTTFMKSECGGLQTLLRNHDFVFVVRDGSVRLRCYADPSDLTLSRAKKRKVNGKTAARNSKTKLCWFHENHPQGCSLSKEECPWAHGSEDLHLVASDNL